MGQSDVESEWDARLEALAPSLASSSPKVRIPAAATLRDLLNEKG